MSRLPKFAVIVLLLVPAIVSAQQGPPPEPRDGGRDAGGQPPPPKDSFFFLGQAMRALDEKVDLLLEQKQNDAAVVELRRVYAIDVPKDRPVFEMKARLIGRLAGLYAASAKKAEALETIRTLLAEVPAGSPAEAAAWLDAGTVYRALGMPEEALKAFDRAIDVSSKLATTAWQDEGRRPPRGGGRDRPPGERKPDRPRQP